MRVSPEVLQHLDGAAEGRFGVGHHSMARIGAR
jgi:hypothetical protein